MIISSSELRKIPSSTKYRLYRSDKRLKSEAKKILQTQAEILPYLSLSEFLDNPLIFVQDFYFLFELFEW